MLTHFFADIPHNVFCLFMSVHKLAEMQFFSFCIFRPERFSLSFHIILNHLIRCIQNVLGRTIILFQANHLCIRENFLKSQNISDVGAAELVNRLVVISHHAEITVFICQKADKLKLGGIGILILIHHNILKPVLEIFQYIRAGAEKLHCFHNQIIKIQSIVLFQFFLVFLVSQGNLPLGKIGHHVDFVLLRADELVLGRRNRSQNCSFLVHLGINIQALANIFHQRFLVIGIINRKIGVVSQTVNKPAQHSHTTGVKRGNPDAFRAKSHNLIHTFPHFSCCLVGKGNGHNIPGIHTLFFY